MVPYRAFGFCALSALLLACSSSSGSGGTGPVHDSGAEALPSGDASDGADGPAPMDAAPGADGPQSADAATDATGGDAGCNNVVNGAPTIQETIVASAAPTPAGGTIPDGTYFLTGVTIYEPAADAGGPTGTSFKATSQVSGTTFQYDVVETGGTTPGEQRQSGTIVTNGSSLTVTFTCGATGKSSLNAFDGNATTVTLYGPDGAGKTIAYAYTKQ